MWYEQTRLDWSIDQLRELNSVYWSLSKGWYEKPGNLRRFPTDIKDVVMAGKKDKKDGQSTGTSARFSGQVTWNNVAITDSDVVSIDEWQIDLADLLGEIVILVENGYTFSTKFEGDGRTIGAYLISSRVGAADVGYGLSGRASGVIDACKVLLYKYHQICEGRCDHGHNVEPRKFS